MAAVLRKAQQLLPEAAKLSKLLRLLPKRLRSAVAAGVVERDVEAGAVGGCWSWEGIVKNEIIPSYLEYTKVNFLTCCFHFEVS